MASKLGRVLTSGGRLSMQTLKSSLNSCFFFSFSSFSVLLDGLPKGFFEVFYRFVIFCFVVCVTKIRPISLDTLKTVSIKIVP